MLKGSVIDQYLLFQKARKKGATAWVDYLPGCLAWGWGQD
jgi:hypothetical protein